MSQVILCRSGKSGRRRNSKETAATSRKTRPQDGREKERQKLWLLWKDSSTPSGLKLPSIRTTVFEVWQVQPLCVMLQNWCSTPRGIQGDQERASQENNRGWGDKQWLRCWLHLPSGDSTTPTPSEKDKIRTKSRHCTNPYWRHWCFRWTT